MNQEETDRQYLIGKLPADVTEARSRTIALINKAARLSAHPDGRAGPIPALIADPGDSPSSESAMTLIASFLALHQDQSIKCLREIVTGRLVFFEIVGHQDSYICGGAHVQSGSGGSTKRNLEKLFKCIGVVTKKPFEAVPANKHSDDIRNFLRREWESTQADNFRDPS